MKENRQQQTKNNYMYSTSSNHHCESEDMMKLCHGDPPQRQWSEKCLTTVSPRVPPKMRFTFPSWGQVESSATSFPKTHLIPFSPTLITNQIMKPVIQIFSLVLFDLPGMEKKRNMKNFSYQNNWNRINEKIIQTINEN